LGSSTIVEGSVSRNECRKIIRRVLTDNEALKDLSKHHLEEILSAARNMLLKKHYTKRAERKYGNINKGLFMDTHYTKVWYWKGRVLIDLRKFDDAQKALNNVLTLDPDNKQKRKYGALLLIAAAYLNQNKNKEAMPYLATIHELVKRDPKYADMSFHDCLKYFIVDSTRFNALLSDLIEEPLAEFRDSGFKH